MQPRSNIVHVIPMGLELDRVLGGLKEFPTNHVILLYGKDSSSGIEVKARHNGEKLRDLISATIDIEERMMDIFDFYSAARSLKELFSDLRNRGFEVYVNISTGNRIITSAALLAVFMTGSHPYYVQPERYSIPEGQEVLSHGVSSVMEIPSVTIVGPSREDEQVLKVLGKLGGTARHETSLIPYLETVRGFFKPRKESESKRSYLARNRAHLSRTLRSLEKDGYVTLIKKGRYVNVSLTDTGLLFAGPPENILS
ncbi:MAG: DUF6293 family protein [Thermoplasmatota archaeon]